MRPSLKALTVIVTVGFAQSPDTVPLYFSATDDLLTDALIAAFSLLYL